MLNKILILLRRPEIAVKKILMSKCGRLIPDKLYLKIMYRLELGEKLNLHNPITFNEKLQWLKLYDRKPIYTIMVDKFLARNYVKSKCGEGVLIPLIDVWSKAEDINFEKLPDAFVIK